MPSEVFVLTTESSSPNGGRMILSAASSIERAREWADQKFWGYNSGSSVVPYRQAPMEITRLYLDDNEPWRPEVMTRIYSQEETFHLTRRPKIMK